MNRWEDNWLIWRTESSRFFIYTDHECTLTNCVGIVGDGNVEMKFLKKGFLRSTFLLKIAGQDIATECRLVNTIGDALRKRQESNS